MLRLEGQSTGFKFPPPDNLRRSMCSSCYTSPPPPTFLELIFFPPPLFLRRRTECFRVVFSHDSIQLRTDFIPFCFAASKFESSIRRNFVLLTRLFPLA